MSVKNSKIVVTEKYPNRTYQLQTSDLQKGNIDLSKLSTKSKYILCVFDTKKKDGSSGADGFLSRQEINEALNYFGKFADKEERKSIDYDEKSDTWNTTVIDKHFSFNEQRDAFKALVPKVAQKTGTKYTLNDRGYATFVKTQGNKTKSIVDVVYCDIQSALIELKGLIDNKKLEEARQSQYNNKKLKPTK